MHSLVSIILLDKVGKLGALGDVVKVKAGYARNYLIPHGLAKRATAANKAEFENRRAELEKVQSDKLAAAQALGTKLDGLLVQITRKSGMDGRLFGSVSNIDIAEAIAALGFEIERSFIRLPDGHLKAVGDHSIDIALHPDVVVSITVAVLGEQ